MYSCKNKFCGNLFKVKPLIDWPKTSKRELEGAYGGSDPGRLERLERLEDSNIKMPGCVCWGSENAPILNDTSSCKNIPILNGFSAQFIHNVDGNIKIQVLTYTYHL